MIGSYPDRTKSPKRPLLTLQEIGEKYGFDKHELHSLYASDGWPMAHIQTGKKNYYDPLEIARFLKQKGKV